MTSLVIGLGQIGQAIYEILLEKYGEKKVFGYDIKEEAFMPKKVDILHICIPWEIEDFVAEVNSYVNLVKPKYTIIHSSVPVGTTKQIKGMAFHSPVRGKHPDMMNDIYKYTKYLSFDNGDVYEAQDLCDYFDKAGVTCKTVSDTKTTELGKLLALARYGVYIAFAKEQEAICEKYDVPYHKAVTDFEKTRNEEVDPKLRHPLLFPFEGFIGGHCTVEDMAILLADKEMDAPLMAEAYNIGRATKIWGECNIYPSAKIGKGCNIGNGCEIGENVVIGNNVRIGANSFIPEGITIKDNVFVAPGVFFSNDKYPPSDKKAWGKSIIEEGAMLGMGSIILPGVTVGEKAFIGAGSIVTKDVPAGEKWYGNPAHAHGEAPE